MEAALASAPTETAVTPRVDTRGERRCLVTGALRPKDDLIRFVVGPDTVIVPDLAGDLPGRGLWVTACFADVDQAAKKGLFAKAAKTKVHVDANLAAETASLLRVRCLNFIGLARGAGIAVLGQPQVEAALKARKIDLLLLAQDAGATLGYQDGVPSFTNLARDELGAALGHDQIVYAGLTAHGLTEKLKSELKRLTGMTQERNG